ncbi:MAG: DUF6841 family protein, partial [Mycobacteriaceae bacterium]
MDRTREEWRLSTGQNRGPTPGHQRGLSHGHGQRWFGAYLNAFAACGRGESQASSLIAYYGVRLLVSTDEGFAALATGEEVVSM